jgi:2,4-dienoyl-CoA reductase-like NADH-dependent reductase (Old Yellow Enzyme family)
VVARDAGFAGVQLHGAHGYLISQFLSSRTNRRDDAWGGDATRRSRFLIEIVRAIRAAVGPAFPIGVKLNSADFQRGGFTIEEAMDVARAPDAASICSRSPAETTSPAMTGSGELPAAQRQSSRGAEAYFLEYARADPRGRGNADLVDRRHAQPRGDGCRARVGTSMSWASGGR